MLFHREFAYFILQLQKGQVVKESLYSKLRSDIRMQEGLRACINCGTCSAICPAASFYNYDPKKIATLVQTGNDEEIEKLLKSETIWYCGECMSCKTRCPRGNTPGLIIMALRKLSIETGFFTESEKGRQVLALKRTIGENILKYGYCVHVSSMDNELHPELGPVWKWIRKNAPSIYNRLGGNYNKEGKGALRKISDADLKDLDAIFEQTGAHNVFASIEKHSYIKALEMGFTNEQLQIKPDPYFTMVYKKNSSYHTKSEA
jgi:heterodisulfide reductase subunit C1